MLTLQHWTLTWESSPPFLESQFTDFFWGKIEWNFHFKNVFIKTNLSWQPTTPRPNTELQNSAEAFSDCLYSSSALLTKLFPIMALSKKYAAVKMVWSSAESGLTAGLPAGPKCRYLWNKTSSFDQKNIRIDSSLHHIQI